MAKKLYILVVAMVLILIGIALAVSPASASDACVFNEPETQGLPPPITQTDVVQNVGVVVGSLFTNKDLQWTRPLCMTGVVGYHQNIHARGSIQVADSFQTEIGGDGLDMDNTIAADIVGSGIYQESAYTFVTGPVGDPALPCVQNTTAICDEAFDQVGGMFNSAQFATQNTVSNYPNAHNTMQFQSIVGPSTQGQNLTMASGSFRTQSKVFSIIGDASSPTVVNGTFSPTAASTYSSSQKSTWIGTFAVSHQFTHSSGDYSSLIQGATTGCATCG